MNFLLTNTFDLPDDIINEIGATYDLPSEITNPFIFFKGAWVFTAFNGEE